MVIYGRKTRLAATASLAIQQSLIVTVETGRRDWGTLPGDASFLAL
jgi:hypothetical protein